MGLLSYIINQWGVSEGAFVRFHLPHGESTAGRQQLSSSSSSYRLHMVSSTTRRFLKIQGAAAKTDATKSISKSNNIIDCARMSRAREGSSSGRLLSLLFDRAEEGEIVYLVRLRIGIGVNKGPSVWGVILPKTPLQKIDAFVNTCQYLNLLSSEGVQCRRVLNFGQKVFGAPLTTRYPVKPNGTPPPSRTSYLRPSCIRCNTNHLAGG